MYPLQEPEHIHYLFNLEGKEEAMKILRSCAELVHYKGYRQLALTLNELADSREAVAGNAGWKRKNPVYDL